MKTSLLKKYSTGLIHPNSRFNMTDDMYACFIEFVELNDITEYEWPAYFEAYFQMLKEI